MTAAQNDTIDLAGVASVATSVTLKVAEWFGLFDFNSIIISVTGILGIVYMVYKIKMIKLELREKKKEKK